MSFKEQIMSKDKYPCIFSQTNGDYCVYYPSNIFRTVAAQEYHLNWGISLGYSPILVGHIVSHDAF